MEQDYYSLLGVSRFVTKDALKRAYRFRMLAVHPDRNPLDRTSEQRTREIIEAYRVLSNPDARRQYDAALVQCARPAAVYYRPSEFSPLVSRFIVVALAFVFIACLAYLVVHAMTDRGPVFRPNIDGIVLLPAPKPPAVVMYPDISNSLEWYYAWDYELNMGSEGAALNLMRIYSESTRRALLRKNWSEAHYYAVAVENILNSSPLASLYTPHDM